LSLSFNNKNQYRKYPLKQNAGFASTDGYVIPDNLIANAAITSVYGKHRICIKQIYYNNNFLRLTIASYFDGVALGVFAGQVSTDFTTLQLTAFERNLSGTLTIGAVEALRSIDRILYFENNQAEFEESVIFCYDPPAVTSIQDRRGNEIRGIVAFGNLTSIAKDTDRETGSVKLSAIYPETIFNSGDKSTWLGNCQTPTIKTINNVPPFAYGEADPVNDGNIYIAGIKPIVFFGLPGDLPDTTKPGILYVNTEGLTLDSLCASKHKLLPPTDISGFSANTEEFKDKYYTKPELESQTGVIGYPSELPARAAGNFNKTQVPEYYFWPQFVQEDYYNTPAYWPPKQT
jgi:hypothetical protein